MKTTVCSICGESFHTPQGLAGHKQFKHHLGRKTDKTRIIEENIRRMRNWDLIDAPVTRSLPAGSSEPVRKKREVVWE